MGAELRFFGFFGFFLRHVVKNALVVGENTVTYDQGEIRVFGGQLFIVLP